MDPAETSEGDAAITPLDVKSCLTCRHGGYNPSIDRSCNRPFQSSEPYVFRACRTERAPDGACGVEGKFYEPPFRREIEPYEDRYPLPRLPVPLNTRTTPRYIRPIAWRTPEPAPDIPIFDFGFGLSTFEKWTFSVMMALIIGSMVYCAISMHAPRF